MLLLSVKCCCCLLNVAVVVLVAVFGNTGLHMVLRGKVVPLTEPYVYTGLEDDQLDLRSLTPVLENVDIVVSFYTPFSINVTYKICLTFEYYY